MTAALYVQRYSGTFEHLPELAVPGTSLVWVSVMLNYCTVFSALRTLLFGSVIALALPFAGGQAAKPGPLRAKGGGVLQRALRTGEHSSGCLSNGRNKLPDRSYDIALCCLCCASAKQARSGGKA